MFRRNVPNGDDSDLIQIKIATDRARKQQDRRRNNRVAMICQLNQLVTAEISRLLSS